MLVDGGISDPVPVDLVRELGAEVVIAVNLDFSQEILNITPDQIGLTNIATRTLKVMRHHLAQYSCYGADFIIEPPLQIYSSWSDYFINNNESLQIRSPAPFDHMPVKPHMIVKPVNHKQGRHG